VYCGFDLVVGGDDDRVVNCIYWCVVSCVPDVTLTAPSQCSSETGSAAGIRETNGVTEVRV